MKYSTNFERDWEHDTHSIIGDITHMKQLKGHQLKAHRESVLNIRR